VAVEGVPCFSCRYPSEHEAISMWEQFKLQATKSSIPAVRR
jgi:hypothetical protein